MHRSDKLCFKINQYSNEDSERRPLLEELFENRLPKTSNIYAPLEIDSGHQVEIGEHVFINHNVTMMAHGGIKIDDGVMIGPHASLLTVNHDFHNHRILEVSPIHLKKNAWIGANTTILSGITIGENAIVAAGAVVTKDVEPNTIVGGNPAHVLKKIDD
ncbi:DapH/DapD/GlmU-related protein [Lactobacillus hamsteri]|nr:DapH/DapD/GlmU-related protein [Lactobacillus hamsteri]